MPYRSGPLRAQNTHLKTKMFSGFADLVDI